MPLQELLESRGHEVVWNSASAAGPSADAKPSELVVLDAEDPQSIAAAKAWRDADPPPGVMMIGRSEQARARATEARCHFVASNADAAVFNTALQSVLQLRFAGRMSGPYARAVLGLGPATDTQSDAARIVAGARKVNLDLVRECLRWRAYEYVVVTELVAVLRQQRALIIPEVAITELLDGTRTVQSLVSAKAGDGVLAGRLLWALLSCGGARSSKEPPDERTPTRKAITSTRRHLLARRQRLERSTHYDVLEVPRSANARLVDYAARTLAVRYAPDRLASLDLGDLVALVGANWQQILVARNVLMDDTLRANYDELIESRRPQLTGAWAFDVSDPSVAEEFFKRGQAALIAGQASKAVSEIAGACRNHPEHPTYEAYLCWARFRSEADRGGEREGLARKERQIAEKALIGRRPWPLALVALAMLCAADNDPDSAKYHLGEALSIDPNLPLAKQLMSRLR